MTPQTRVTGALAVGVGAEVYTLQLAGDGQPVTVVIAGNGPVSVAYGFNSASTLSQYAAPVTLP